MQFINLNFIGRKNNRRGKTRGIQQLHTAATCQRCEKSRLHVRNHALSKMLHIENVLNKDALLKYSRIKLLQQLNNRLGTEVFLGAVSAPREADLKKKVSNY